MSLETTLKSGVLALGTPLSDEKIALFRRYYDLLDRRSREFNLTAIHGEDETATLHFLDSLAVLRYVDLRGKKVIDVGCGAGFPGWPLKLAEESIDLTLLDSTEKKVTFLREVSAALGLPANCLHGRAEEQGALREQYDAAVSRAVARLNVLAELCLPFVKVGGVFAALKAADSGEEIAEALPAIRALGGAAPEVRDYLLPGADIPRRIVLIQKISPTPKKYPRRYAKILKSPIT
ncbi:MAG: 16S rRNA (guanine(527)-N(7))-methyltransferase RsmG [bacterium]